MYDSRNNLTVTAGICNTLFLSIVLNRSLTLNVLLDRVFGTKLIKQLSYGLRIAKLRQGTREMSPTGFVRVAKPSLKPPLIERRITSLSDRLSLVLCLFVSWSK